MAPTRRIDRVDIKKLADGSVVVSKYQHRSTGADRLISTEVKHPDEFFNVRGAIKWLKENGFTVRTWPDHPAGFPAGARAFRGEPWPIRSRREIFNRRREVESALIRWHRENPGIEAPNRNLTLLDFAFDL